jgi:glucose/arabinose dehydrogenase
MHVPGPLIALGCVALMACGTKTPAPPIVDSTPDNITITGTERIGWDQPAADAVELATIGYVIYVDGTRTPLIEVSCAATTSASFACNARLPALSRGSHALQLASFVMDGGIRESARSAPLQVTVAQVAGATAAPLVSAEDTKQRVATATSRADVPVAITRDGIRLRTETLAHGLEAPTDLAVAPDGRLFVAERRGRIRIIRDGRLLSEPAVSLADTLGADGRLLALALHPEFERTRFVFAIYTAPSRSGDPVFSLARFREVSDTLGDRAVLLDGIHASASPAAALRFGPDGKLYAAFDDGGDASRGDGASPNGKMLRLNADGTTPKDQAGSTPIYSIGSHAPGGFDWDPRSGALWIADGEVAGQSHLRVVLPDPGARAGEMRGVVRATFPLPAASAPASVAFYRGRRFPELANSLLVAPAEGGHLLRIAVGDRSTSVAATTEYRVDGVRLVAVGADGTVYFGTAAAVGRLVPERVP